MPFYDRKNMRFPGLKYAGERSYFVTIVCHEHQRWFGQVIDGNMQLNELGEMADRLLSTPGELIAGVDATVHVVMPDHVHILFNILEEDAPPLGAIVGKFKMLVEREARRMMVEKGLDYRRLWQRNYYDHVIRDIYDYHIKVVYIYENPMRWFLKRGNGG